MTKEIGKNNTIYIILINGKPKTYNHFPNYFGVRAYQTKRQAKNDARDIRKEDFKGRRKGVKIQVKKLTWK